VPYEFVDDGVTSDVTFHAWAEGLDQLFVAAADATLNVMVRVLDSVRAVETRTASLEADALDLLLRRFLDELIYRKDVEELLLRATRVAVDAAHPRLDAVLAGERIDPERHELLADVKAVTFHDLRVERTATGWDALFRIPYTALNFPGGEGEIWGFNFSRILRRRTETARWSGWKRIWVPTTSTCFYPRSLCHGFRSHSERKAWPKVERAELSAWRAEAKILECPCHASLFDPRDSARVVSGPARKRLSRLPLKIVDGALVAGGGFSGRVGFQPG